MNAEERRAEFQVALARSRVLLDPETCEATIAEEMAATRVHRDDGYLSDWHAGMPRPEPTPERRSLTDAEAARVELQTREALAQYQSEAFVDGRIEAAFEVHNEVHARIIAAERKRWRAEFAAEIEKLRAELEIAKAHPSDSAKVIDLSRGDRRAG